MKNNGHGWVQMGTDGFRWEGMGTDEHRWVQMDFDGLRWVQMGLWMSVDALWVGVGPQTDGGGVGTGEGRVLNMGG